MGVTEFIFLQCSFCCPLPTVPIFFQDQLIIFLTYQHKCQWRIQQSGFAPISCSPRECSSAWQNTREVAAASPEELLLMGSRDW